MIYRNLMMGAVCIMAGVVSAAAADRDFHGEALFGLHGPVKDFQTDTKYPLQIFKSMSFSEDGKISGNIPISYNTEGYPVGISIPEELKQVMSFDVTYDTDHNPVKVSLHMSAIGEMKYSMVNEFVDGKVISTDFTVNADGESLPLYSKGGSGRATYTDQVYDSYGNWTSRTTTVSDPSDSSAAPIVYKETRTITYYE